MSDNLSDTGAANPQERRSQPDRRANERSGKYERRKNHCGRCMLFEQADLLAPQGYCHHFKKPIGYHDFACPYYESAKG